MSTKRKDAIAIVLLLSVAIMLLIFTSCTAKASVDEFQKVKVTRVIDGDTFCFKSKGKEVKVRMIGIDAPENGSRKKEYYGKQASAYTKKKLLNKYVYLQQDVSNKDKYGRLLRYVWMKKPSEINESIIRKNMFNAIIVSNGYSYTSEFPPDVKYAELFNTLLDEAKEKKIGMWKNRYSSDY